jgi:hypothetical protein
MGGGLVRMTTHRLKAHRGNGRARERVDARVFALTP